VTQKDYPQVQALALLFGTLVLVINFVVDIALGVIDPRSTILDA
jgi:peptide/nickel transport system permease protein